MCTCLIAGRKATASGYAMLAANDDWDGVKGVLTHVPLTVHGISANTPYILTGGAVIPQAPETCGYVYTACEYAIGTLERGWAGGMNDCGVAVAGTGVDAYIPVDWENKGWLLEPDDIPLLVLQRGTSARQAVRLIGDLINEYGLRPSYIEGSAGSSAATFSIADAEEGWVLEVYPGRCWVAVRIPDDCVSVRINAFGTHDADLTDPENTMCSPGLAVYAREHGLWDGDEKHFDFAAAFGSETSPTEWGPEKDPMNLRRRWRAMYLVDGIREPEETLRYLARPGVCVEEKEKIQEKDQEKSQEKDQKKNQEKGLEKNREKNREKSRKKRGGLRREDMMHILSDVYEGTPYDLTKVPEGGPWHDPFADNMPDYAICRQGTVASFVTAYAGQKKTPLMWTAMGTPRLVPYIPIWTDMESLPEYCEKDGTFLYKEMKRLCTHVRECYDKNAEPVIQAKQKYQERMSEVVEAEADQNAAARTAAVAEHLQDALEICRQYSSSRKAGAVSQDHYQNQEVKVMDSIKKELRKVLMAGLGAAAEGVEKGDALLERLAEKGEDTLKQSKIKNEELKRTIHETIRGDEKAAASPEEAVEAMLNAVGNLGAEQLQALKAHIEKIEQEQASEDAETGPSEEDPETKAES